VPIPWLVSYLDLLEVLHSQRLTLGGVSVHCGQHAVHLHHSVPVGAGLYLWGEGGCRVRGWRGRGNVRGSGVHVMAALQNRVQNTTGK